LDADLDRSGVKEVTGLINEEWKVDSLALGVRSSMALTISVKSSLAKRVWVWGGANLGQAGNGSIDEEDHPVPSEVKYFREKRIAIEKIASGAFHCAVLTVNGELFMWGSNTVGRCGNAKKDGEPVSIPTKVQFIVEESPNSKLACLDILCARDHSLAVCTEMGGSDNRRICFSWGSKYCGELGHGEDGTENFCSPKEILFFRGLEEDYAVTRMGVGYISS